ncbi:hypothetical protein NAEGRDRAFT_80555 [Naegleria gruberi]|uniref:Uncharacterized protein n=1 Tax=Naegleria gruberi TaxID=5762 RepID=D2VML4_NAEGR|nr:uncharacterized protein NAEGRDRAFT_80555 [Naegleria gruberi]EFC42087.1 hypothetical protein NAEGRDRAFT_80555 [Naegleria gruberi]|eukprot:XP_002674831.1 hypothetical protein NAEGRDRAFT_80555 [Naegleria gruberi strain NEG-M]
MTHHSENHRCDSEVVVVESSSSSVIRTLGGCSGNENCTKASECCKSSSTTSNGTEGLENNVFSDESPVLQLKVNHHHQENKSNSFDSNSSNTSSSAPTPSPKTVIQHFLHDRTMPITIDFPQFTIPSLNELFVTRHGEKTSQLIKYGTGTFTSPPSPSSTPSTPVDANGDYEADPPLTDRGFFCASMLGQNLYNEYILKKLEQSIDLPSNDEQVRKTFQLYTSPFHRCLQTTETLLKAVLEEAEKDGYKLNVQVFIDFGLMEFYGLKRLWSFDMMPPNIETIRKEFPLLAEYIVEQYDSSELDLESEYFALNPTNYLKYFTQLKQHELMYDLIRRVRGTFVNIQNNVSQLKQSLNTTQDPTVLIITHAATMIRVVEEIIGIYHRLPLTERINVKASICGLSHITRSAPDESNKSEHHHNSHHQNHSKLHPWKLVTNNDISFMEKVESINCTRPPFYYQIDSSHYIHRK